MPSKPRFDMSVVRKLAAERVDGSSLRAVASEIGMSKSGLEDFLKGREPYTTTRPKLIAWHVRNRRPGAEPSRDEIEVAVAVLRQHIDSGGPESEREERGSAVAQRLFGRKR